MFIPDPDFFHDLRVEGDKHGISPLDAVLGNDEIPYIDLIWKAMDLKYPGSRSRRRDHNVIQSVIVECAKLDAVAAVLES